MWRAKSARRIFIGGAFLFCAAPAGAAPVIVPLQSGAAFAVSNSDLLQTNLAAGGVTAVGTFAREGEQGETALRDGGFGNLGGQNAQGGAALAAATAGSGDVLTYTLNTTVNTAGYKVTNVNTTAGWDSARYAQKYDLSFHLVGAPAGTFTAPISVDYEPAAIAGNNNTSVAISDGTGVLATGVDQVRFTFADAPNVTAGGYQGYRELDVIGSANAVPEPASLGLLAIATAAALRRRTRRA